MKISGIYCLTSPNGKSYVGQSVDIQKRIRSYRTLHCSAQPKIYSALKKYGFENFKFTVLEECPISELDSSEIFYINYFDTVSNGYNLCSGGFGSRHSNETKLKLSLMKKGNKMSEEQKIKLSIINKGKILTDDHKKKMSDSHIGKKKSANHKKNLSNRFRITNVNWGIYPNHDKFFVRFRQNDKTYKKYGFKSINDALEWRDSVIID